MNQWQIIRTAHHLAQLGTISAAARVLGVHRATVLRHVDALEEELGVNLFQRHARGYIPTEAGKALTQVVSATKDQLEQLVGRLKQTAAPLSGPFIITSLAPLTFFLMPILKVYQQKHPAIQVQYITSKKLFRLEYGEAHVAIRAGAKPQLPDNVVIPLATHQVSLFAHKDYLARHEHPATLEDLAGHQFISFNELTEKVPVHQWILNNINKADIVFNSNNDSVIKQALLEGLGIGFMFRHEAQQYAQLVELFAPITQWQVPCWLVTHRDLHHSRKVQAFLDVVRTSIPDYSAFKLMSRGHE